MEAFFYGFIAGIAATAAMTAAEIPSWKRWGLHGVFEWHENQVITAYLLRSPGREKISYPGIFFFHFLNGTLVGIAFPYIAAFLLPAAPLLLPGILYGIVLWVLTLAPIHKPITGLHPWNHPLGRMPAIASLAGHMLYGIVLGVAYSALAGLPLI